MSNITVTKVGVLSIGKLLGTVNLIVGLAIILRQSYCTHL